MKLLECVIMDIKNLSITQLDNFQAEIIEARDKYDRLKKAATESYGDLKAMQSKMVGILSELDRTSHKSKHGSISYYYPERYKITDKAQFFEFLKAEYDPSTVMGMLTVNSQTLNSWAKVYVEEKEDRDNFEDIIIPGIEAKTGDAIVSMRK